MFNITGDFSQGAYMNGQLNGFQTMVMQRQQDIDNVIRDFEVAVAAGYNPNLVQGEIFAKYGISHLTAAESERITRAVEKAYHSKKGHN